MKNALELIIAYGITLNCCICKSLQTGQTILHSACSLEDLNIVRFLLNRQDCNFTIQEHVSQCMSYLCIPLVFIFLNSCMDIHHYM